MSEPIMMSRASQSRTSIKTLSLTLGLSLLVLSPSPRAEFIKTFEGWKVYMSSCILCHGPEGRGNGALAKKLGLSAADFRARRQRLEGLSDRALVNEIKGASGHMKGMPKWRNVYADPQLQAAVAYVRYLSRSPHPLMGDPVEGQEYYQRYCSSCHGKSGRGDGFMIDLLDIKPADHTSAQRMDQRTNAQLIAIIKKGKGLMPGWEGIISDHHIGELVSYIRLLSHPEGR